MFAVVCYVARTQATRVYTMLFAVCMHSHLCKRVHSYRYALASFLFGHLNHPPPQSVQLYGANTCLNFMRVPNDPSDSKLPNNPNNVNKPYNPNNPHSASNPDIPNKVLFDMIFVLSLSNDN